VSQDASVRELQILGKGKELRGFIKQQAEKAKKERERERERELSLTRVLENYTNFATEASGRTLYRGTLRLLRKI